jgi:hypothetical protein
MFAPQILTRSCLEFAAVEYLMQTAMAMESQTATMIAPVVQILQAVPVLVPQQVPILMEMESRIVKILVEPIQIRFILAYVVVAKATLTAMEMACPTASMVVAATQRRIRLAFVVAE